MATKRKADEKATISPPQVKKPPTMAQQRVEAWRKANPRTVDKPR